MEKGNAAQFKNKTLDEIEIDMENIEYDVSEKCATLGNGKIYWCCNVNETN